MQQIPNTHAYEYDATEIDMDSTFQAIEQKLGPVSVLLYNAGPRFQECGGGHSFST
ncbi:MAG: hypothetical protein MH208_16800 [Marinobacter sp.]|nr:hypothetical protein [Marinobacter sp.]